MKLKFMNTPTEYLIKWKITITFKNSSYVNVLERKVFEMSLHIFLHHAAFKFIAGSNAWMSQIPLIFADFLQVSLFSFCAEIAAI